MSTGGTNVGEIQARIILDIAEFRRNIDEARRRIQDLEDQSRRGADGMRNLGSALTGLGAGAALTKLVREMQSVVAEAAKLYNAFQGLNAVAKGFGIQTKDAQQAAQDLAKRGFLSLTEAVLAYKTAMSTGLNLEESTNLINSLADSAAYNRQSFYTMGGAIQASLDGIKNGNSVLSDAVGVTKNLSVMQKEYAASIGTTAGRLTDAQKIQAAYYGFMREGAIFTGNADEAMQGFTGSQNRFTQATNEATVALGEAFTPVVQETLEALTPVIIGLADFVTENQALVSGLATGTAGVLAFVTVLATVPPALALIKAGITALGASAGPIGLAIVAIGALAGGIGALVAKRNEDAKATENMMKAQKELNALLDKAPVDQTASDIETLTAKTEELTEALRERASLQERLNAIEALQNSGEGTPQLLSEAIDINEALGEMDVKLRTLGFDGVEQATDKLEEMNNALKYSVASISDQDKAEASALATKKQTLKEMSAMAAEFKKLNSAQDLDASQKNRLVDITEKLIAQYPSLNAHQGEDGRIRADNIDAIISQIATDKKFTDAAADHVAQRIRNFSKENEAQAKSVQTQIDNYTRLIKAMSQVSGARATTFADSVKQGEGLMNGKMPGVGDLVFNDYITNKAKQEAQAKLDEALAQQQKYSDAAREMEKLAAEVEVGAQTFTKDIIAPDGPKAAKEKKATGKTAAELAAEARKAAYDADLKTVQFQADFYDMTADAQIKKYEELRKKHAKFLAESIDDARTLQLQLKRLSEDSVQSRYEFSTTWIDAESKRMEDSGKTELAIAEMKLASWTRLRNRYAKDSAQYKAADEEVRRSRKEVAAEELAESRAQYDASAKWITAEERRMSDAGKSEVEIAQMKLDAWTRVRARYAKDTEFYAQADEQLYNARKDLTKKTVALADELVKKQKDAIKAAKDADLKAIEERKQAALDDYDARIDAIQRLRDANKEINADADYATQLAEKQARLAELASAVGPAGIAERDALLKEIARMQLEHDRELTDRTLADQQDALSDEKAAQTKAYEAEKNAAEAQYDALTAAFDAYSGDIKTIEAGIAAFRITEAANANTTILSDLDTFVTQYNAKLAQLAKTSATPNAQSATTAATSPVVSRSNKATLSTQQQSVLYGLIARPSLAPTTPAAPTYITNNIDMGAENVTLTDRADIGMYYDEKARAFSRIAATGVKLG